MAISCNQPIRIFRALSRISCVAFLHFQSLPSETPSLRTPQRSQTMRTGPPQPRARRKAPKRLSSAVVSSQLPRPPFPRSRTSPHGFASVLKQDMWLCGCVCVCVDVYVHLVNQIRTHQRVVGGMCSGFHRFPQLCSGYVFQIYFSLVKMHLQTGLKHAPASVAHPSSSRKDAGRNLL